MQFNSYSKAHMYLNWPLRVYLSVFLLFNIAIVSFVLYFAECIQLHINIEDYQQTQVLIKEEYYWQLL